MKFNTIYIGFVLLAMLFSCKDAVPRHPVQVKSGEKVHYSVERTKKQLEVETSYIKKYIDKDTLLSYQNTNMGYWLAKLKQDSLQTYYPKFGDKVVYSYDIRDLKNQTIYTKEEIGERSYYIDQENPPIRGFRTCLKAMKEGDVAKVVFPSQMAYGYTGDRKRIGVNMPLICTIEIIKIIKEEVK